MLTPPLQARGTLNDTKTKKAYETITNYRLEQAMSEDGYWTPLQHFEALIEAALYIRSGKLTTRDGEMYENLDALNLALTEILQSFHYDEELVKRHVFQALDLHRRRASVAIHIAPTWEDIKARRAGKEGEKRRNTKKRGV